MIGSLLDRRCIHRKPIRCGRNRSSFPSPSWRLAWCSPRPASFAKGLFPAVGAAGATTLRLTLAAIVLLAIFRPWRQKLDTRQWRAVLAYGAVMGACPSAY
jgi:hypothetical protein